jgi:hypothetical protein
MRVQGPGVADAQLRWLVEVVRRIASSSTVAENSIPRLPQAEIRKVVSRHADTSQPVCSVQVSNTPWVFPLISRSRQMGAIVLLGRRGSRLSRGRRTMLGLLATLTAISLDNLILSHNEWTQLPNVSAMKPRVEEAIRLAAGPGGGTVH